MKPNLAQPKKLALDLLYDLGGCALYAVGTQVFNAPANIAPGGITGISILANYLLGAPISLVSFVINIPLLIAALFFLGRRFTLRTAKTVLIMTLMLELAGRFVPAYTGEIILAALAGGVLAGVGLALVFMRGSTTGGTDIIARLIQKKRPDMAVGRLLLILDAVVLLMAAVIYRNIESALFALVGIFTRTQVLDSILFGLDMGKVLMIVTEKPREMAVAINARIGRGCTLLDGRGSYTMQDRPVLLCVVRKNQYYDLKRLCGAVDPDAFVIAMQADEIIGKGFKEIAGGEG